MSQFEFFSPAEEIRKYYREFAGSIQNKSHSKALEYLRKIENLREYFSTYLGIKDTHLISFQFNNYYINRLIFTNLKVDASWEIYSDDLELKDEFTNSKIYSLKNLLHSKASQTKNKKLIWLNKLKNISLELFEAVKKLNIECGENNCYIFLSLDYLLYSASKITNFLRDCSFLVFNPSELFQEYGIALLAFKKEIKIKPIFMGSGAAKFNRETKNIEIRGLPHSLEIGTQNLISLIVLERFFYFLSTRTEEILRRLKDPFVNFNLSENLYPK